MQFVRDNAFSHNMLSRAGSSTLKPAHMKAPLSADPSGATTTSPNDNTFMKTSFSADSTRLANSGDPAANTLGLLHSMFTKRSNVMGVFDPDWIYFAALFLWCLSRTLKMTFFVVDDIIESSVLNELLNTGLLLLVVREVIVFVNQSARIFLFDSFNKISFHIWFRRLRSSNYFKFTLVALPIFLVTYQILWLHTQDRLAQYVLLFAYCARTISFRRVATYAVIVCWFIFVYVLTSAAIGYITNYCFGSPYQPLSRWCLGFKYPLFPAAMLFNITLLVLFLAGKNLNWKLIVFLCVVNGCLYWLTRSKLSCFLSFGAIILCTLQTHFKLSKLLRCIAPVLALSFVICAAFSIIASALYSPDNDFLVQLDIVFEGRLSLGHQGLVDYPITIYGNEITLRGASLYSYKPELVSSPYFYLDCLYLQILLRNGPIVLCAMLVGYSFSAFRAWRDKDYVLLIALTAIAIHMAVDDLTLRLQYNGFVLLLFSSWCLLPRHHSTKLNQQH